MKVKHSRTLPRKLRFTREGRVFVLLVIGVGAAAVNTGNNLLYLVLGLLLSMIVLSGFLSEWVIQRLKIRRVLPKRAFADAEHLVEFEVENQKRRLPSYSIELEDVVEGEPIGKSVYLLKVESGQKATAAYRYQPNKRGMTQFTGVIVRTRYPFGLFEKWRVLTLADGLLVFPSLATAGSGAQQTPDRGSEIVAERAGMGSERGDLRDYREGDAVRDIHWRRTASLGRMVVRQRLREQAKKITIHIDERAPSEGENPVWRESFESAIRDAARQAARASEEGAAIEVRAKHSHSPLVLPGQPPDEAWRFLALLEPRSRDKIEERREAS